MKRQKRVFLIGLLAAILGYLWELYLIHSHPPFIFVKIKPTWWMQWVILFAAWRIGVFISGLWKTQPTASSQKENDREEELKYLSRIYQDLSNSLRLEKGKFEAVLRGAPDGIFTLDEVGRINFWNESMEKLTELKKEDVLGKPYEDVLTFYSTGKLVGFEQGTMEGSSSSEPRQAVNFFSFNGDQSLSFLEIDAEVSGGKEFPAAVSVSTLKSPDKKNTEQIIITVKDMTAQKEIEKLREEMIAMITHDLRSPLSSILGYAGLLQNPKLCVSEEDRQKFLTALIRSGKGMLLLINNLLETARLGDGKVPVISEPVKIKMVLEEVAENLLALAKGKNLSLSVEAKDNLWADSDKDKLHEILTNLVSNAIKFSRSGEAVKITAFEKAQEVVISISDSGPGIRAEEKEYLFEKFSKIKKQGSTTGLGLYIVKKLTDKINGRIVVESQEAIGSTFTLKLPASKKASSSVQLSLVGSR